MIKKNNKGMTLVEIVIVLLIASIAMTITGGILVNSLGYFDDNTKTSIDKQTGDGILSFIDDEIKYSTKITVAKDKPDEKDWHSIYVNSNGNIQMLYRDGNEVFSEDYYSKRNLSIKIRGFTLNEHRLDMTIILNDKNDKKVYSTANTFELINLNMENSSDSSDLYNNISKSNTLVNDDNKIWYLKETAIYDNKGDNNTNTDGSNITVANQIHCIETDNNRGDFVSSRSYKQGEFVYSDGYWWQLVHCDLNWLYTKPGEDGTRWWKRIDRVYTYKSAYTVGDVVYYEPNGNYYQCLKTISGTGATATSDDKSPSEYNGQNSGYWKRIGPKNTVTVDSHVCITVNRNENYTTLRDELDKKTDLDSVPKYETTNSYNVGAWVYTDDRNGVKKYYRKVLNGTGGPGSSSSSGWQLLSFDWDQNSTYMPNDIVYYQDKYIQAQKQIDFEISDPKSWQYSSTDSTDYAWKQLN